MADYDTTGPAIDHGYGLGYLNPFRPDAPAPPVPKGPMIDQEIVVGSTPGSPTGKSPHATPGELYTISVQAAREYVAGGTYTWYANYIRSLPWSIDDVTTDFGDDLYERMMFDPQVFACVTTLKAAALSMGVHLIPAVANYENEENAQAKEIRDFCQRSLDNLSTPLHDVLWEMLDALQFGNKVAEALYAVADEGVDKGKIILKALKVKPRHATAFVVDVYLNVIGLLGLIPGQGAPVQVGTILTNPGQQPNLLPREKFAVFTFRPRNGDPRGTSILRAAYNAWWLKQQVWPEYLKYITQFASPSLVGKTAMEAQADPPTDANANVTSTVVVTPEQSMLAALQQLRNGTALVVPYGAEVDPLTVPGDGEVFREALHLFDRQITKAILSQTLATEESQHQTRAAASVHQDVLSLIIRQVKMALEYVIRRDIIRPLVKYNFPYVDAEKLLPLVSLGDVETQDFAMVMQGVAALMRAGYFDQSQLPGMDTYFNFPTRDLANPQPIIANAAPADVSESDRSGTAYDTGKTPPAQTVSAPTNRAMRSLGSAGVRRRGGPR